MSDFHSTDSEFLRKLNKILSENLSDDRFGVSELAGQIGMSRSNLLRKVKKLTKLSVSQFISQFRLKNAMDLLKKASLTVSEVSFEVGFSSTSYFIKCFREYYGFPPGEVGKREEDNQEPEGRISRKRKKLPVLISVAGVLILTFLYIIIFNPFKTNRNDLERSIAVLAFKNDSNDKDNVHIVNGLMESILNHLQKIEDLRVISRTSIEKYRNTSKTIPEIAEELDVNYFVEGSGQKIGDQILLHIQLIEGHTDKHLWSEHYKRDSEDIFKLQIEVAKDIADKIEAIITPDEEKRIEKIPTDNLTAYDYFLKGLELFYNENVEDLRKAIVFFEKAIEHDPEFARAYADIAISYYMMDVYEKERKYSSQINYYSDKALLYDSQLEQSLIAKALFYMYNNEYLFAENYLLKALEYTPNSVLVINILSDFYANVLPNTEKYLEYALKGIQLDIGAHDSVTKSYIYLHVSNALIQTGFVEEAEYYINKSLDYNPDNLFSERVKAYLFFAKTGKLELTLAHMLKTLSRDSTRLDVIQEVGKLYYYMRDYEKSHLYFKKFKDIRAEYNLDIYRGEDAKIGLVYSKMGLKEESENLFDDFKVYADKDNTIYKHLSLCVYYSFHGNMEESIKHLQLFSQQDNYHYWIILFLKIDPLIDNIKDNPETKKMLLEIEQNFWVSHKKFKTKLKEKKLL